MGSDGVLPIEDLPLKILPPQLSPPVRASKPVIWQREHVREPISRLIWGGIGQIGFILVQRIISDVRGQNMSSPRLFEIATLSTLLSGQSSGQEIPGILFPLSSVPMLCDMMEMSFQTPAVCPHLSARSPPENMPTSRWPWQWADARARKSSTGTPMTCPESTGGAQKTAPLPR